MQILLYSNLCSKGISSTLSFLNNQSKITPITLKFYHFYPGLFSSETVSLITWHYIRYLLLLSSYIGILVSSMTAKTLSILFTAGRVPGLWQMLSLLNICWMNVEWINGVRIVKRKVGDRCKTGRVDASMQVQRMGPMHSEMNQEMTLSDRWCWAGIGEGTQSEWGDDMEIVFVDIVEGAEVFITTSENALLDTVIRFFTHFFPLLFY